MTSTSTKLATSIVFLLTSRALAQPATTPPPPPPLPAPTLPAPAPAGTPTPPPAETAATTPPAETATTPTPPPVETAPAPGASVAPTSEPAAPPAESKIDKLLKGFYGTLDVSFDVTTKGMAGLVAYSYALNNPDDPNSGFTRAGGPKTGPVGIVGYMPALSTNLSKIGYGGSHAVAGSPINFIYQIEAGIAITSAPGLNTSYVQQSNVTKTGIGYVSVIALFDGTASTLFDGSGSVPEHA